jgi:hypothetical protein
VLENYQIKSEQLKQLEETTNQMENDKRILQQQTYKKKKLRKFLCVH